MGLGFVASRRITDWTLYGSHFPASHLPTAGHLTLRGCSRRKEEPSKASPVCLVTQVLGTATACMVMLLSVTGNTGFIVHLLMPQPF